MSTKQAKNVEVKPVEVKGSTFVVRRGTLPILRVQAKHEETAMLIYDWTYDLAPTDPKNYKIEIEG